jgi:hypothetical protein
VQALETLDEVLGPWRPNPIALDRFLERKIVDRCRRVPHPVSGRQMPPAEGTVVDARGEGVAFVGFTFANGRNAGCLELTVDPRGETRDPAGAWVTDVPPPAPPAGELEVMNHGHLSSAPGWYVLGRVGDAIGRVVIEPEGGSVVAATVGHGLFLAWWPEKELEGGARRDVQITFRVVGADAEGRQLFSCPGDDCSPRSP